MWDLIPEWDVTLITLALVVLVAFAQLMHMGITASHHRRIGVIEQANVDAPTTMLKVPWRARLLFWWLSVRARVAAWIRGDQ